MKSVANSDGIARAGFTLRRNLAPLIPEPEVTEVHGVILDFWDVDIGEEFIHRGDWFRKTDACYAITTEEPHWSFFVNVMDSFRVTVFRKRAP